MLTIDDMTWHRLDQYIQIVEREDSNNISIQINIKPKPTMKNNCCLTDDNGIEPQRSFSVENLRTGKLNKDLTSGSCGRGMDV